MHDDIDLLAELPPLRDDEPSSLRQDILDELADHLACAYRRELLLTADDPTARSRVLARFGDPVRIAYQLWFQAMWSRIMSQRIVLACSAIMAAASIAAVLFIGSMFQQQQRMAVEQQHALMNALMTLTAKLQEQSAQQAAARSEAGPIRDLVPLKIKLVTVEDPDNHLVGATVNITPDPMKTGDASPSENTDAEGVADFAYVSIGRYRYNISLPWGETAMAKFTVHPAAEHLEVITVPSRPPEAGTVTITSELPEELKSSSAVLVGQLVLLPRNVGELEWSSNGWIWDSYRDAPDAPSANLANVVLFPDGEVWAATQRQAGVTSFFGSGGGMSGPGMMGGGGGSQGSGFFSIPAEALTHQLTSTIFSQFAGSMSGGGDGSMAPPTWVKAENLKLQSGRYQLTWIICARVEQALTTDTERQNYCVTASSQSPSMSVIQSQVLIVSRDALTPLTLSPPQNVVNIVRDALATKPPTTAYGTMGMTSADGTATPPDPTKLRVLLTGAVDQHALGEFALYNEGGNLIVGNDWNWHNKQAYMKRDLEVGRYLLRLDLSDGQHSETRVSIRDAQQPHMELPLPPTLKTFPIEIHGPVDPKVNPNFVIRPVVTVNRKPQVLGETTWTYPKFRPTSVYTSPGTGLVEEIETRQGPRERHRTKFTTEDRAEERFLPLPNGDYELTWDFVLIFPEPNKAGVMLSLPISGVEPIEMPKQTITVDAEHTTWDLKVPDDLWPKLYAKARIFAKFEEPDSGGSTPEPAATPAVR